MTFVTVMVLDELGQSIDDITVSAVTRGGEPRGCIADISGLWQWLKSGGQCFDVVSHDAHLWTLSWTLSTLLTFISANVLDATDDTMATKKPITQPTNWAYTIQTHLDENLRA